MPNNFSLRFNAILRVIRLALVGFAMAPSVLFAQAAAVDCSAASFNRYVKTVSTFRLMEVYVNSLVHAQSRAILEVETGVPMSGADGGDFFGPIGLLGKTMDKVQTEVKSLSISGKRLDFAEEVNNRFVDLSESAEEIIAVGFEMVSVLKTKDVLRATQMFHERSIPAHNDALGAAHTIISGLERQSAIQALKCR